MVIVIGRYLSPVSLECNVHPFFEGKLVKITGKNVADLLKNGKKYYPPGIRDDRMRQVPILAWGEKYA